MPKDFSWGPVSGQNTVTGHVVLPLPPAEAAKAASAFCPQWYFFWGYGV